MLTKALNFANEYINVLKCDIDVIHYARKSLLFGDSHTLIKKQGGLLDVTVGASNGREVCELVGLTYMLNLLSKRWNKNDFGVYCYNGLAVLKIKVDHNQIQKRLQKIFKERWFDIVIQCNMEIVNY